MDEKLKQRIAGVTAKRPRTVLDHLLKYGRITTAELKEKYGYNHPPRAIGDVRDHGISIIVSRETGADGRPMAVYRIDENASVEGGKGGRRAFPKAIKEELVERDGELCALCNGHFPARALQIDHRVPYEIAGDGDEQDAKDLMLVCGSCNRAKSWSCEHCPNRTTKSVPTCETCMWASPHSYTHIATEPKRRLDIVWEGKEVADYDKAAATGDVRVIVKHLIKNMPPGGSRK